MSLVTLDEMEAAFNTVFTGVDNIVAYYADEEPAIQSRALPCIITYPGRASYGTVNRGTWMLSVTREWEALLLAIEAGQGRDTQAQQAVKPFLSSVPVQLATYPNITVTSGNGFHVELPQNSGDNGPEFIQFADVVYGGARFRFSTRTETVVQPQSL